jgi:hypothetical protein
MRPAWIPPSLGGSVLAGGLAGWPQWPAELAGFEGFDHRVVKVAFIEFALRPLGRLIPLLLHPGDFFLPLFE